MAEISVDVILGEWLTATEETIRTEFQSTFEAFGQQHIEPAVLHTAELGGDGLWAVREYRDLLRMAAAFLDEQLAELEQIDIHEE